MADCDYWKCGDINSFLDESGCPRVNCTEDPSLCPEGMRCHWPVECGGCLAPDAGCYLQEGPDGAVTGCNCANNAPPATCDGRFCVPDTEPPCGDHYCPTLPNCTVAPDCDEWNCGDVNSPFDETGCPRQTCAQVEPSNCPEGFRCHSPFADCGVCVGPLMCQMNDDPIPTCDCNPLGDCTLTAYCIPESIPEGECGMR